MATQLQYSLNLSTPAEHWEILHPGRSPRHDHILWTPQQDKAWHKILPNSNSLIVREQLARFTSHPDIFVTPNGFHNWRLLALLRSLNSLYLDFDCPGVDPKRRADEICLQCEDLGIPRPSAFVYSGRGPHAYWFIKETPPSALPRWQALQRYLAKTLGADLQAVDATRVLRVTGTLHGSSGKLVDAEILDQHVWDFDTLADNMFPFTRRQIREMREQTPKKRKASNLVPFRRRSSILNWFYLLSKDIEFLCNSFWLLSGETRGGRIPEGWRDQMLFLYAVAWSYFAPNEERLLDEVMLFHRYWTHSAGFSDRQARGYVSSVLSRYRMKQAGKQIDWRGQKKSPLYHYRKETLLELLAPLLEQRPELVNGLRALVPDNLKRERQAQQREKARRAAGVVDRDTYLARAEERALEALRLRREGKTLREVGQALGISKAAADSLLRRTAKGGGRQVVFCI